MEDEYAYCPDCGLESQVAEFLSNHGRCPYCNKTNHELREDPYDRYGSRRTAAACATCGDLVGQEDYDDSWHHLDEAGHPDHDRDDDHPVEPEFDETDQWVCPSCGAGNVESSCHNCGSRNFEASRKKATMYRHAAPDEDNSSFSETPSNKNQYNAPGGSLADSIRDFMTDGDGRDSKSVQMPSSPNAGGGSKLFGPGGQGTNTGGSTLFGPGGNGLNGTPGALGLAGGDPSSSLADFSDYDNATSRASEPVTAPNNPSNLPNGWSNLAPSTTDTGISAPAQKGAMRVAAIDFLAGQNVTDREELLFRAHRHASERTSQMPVPVAQQVVQQFVAAVNREIAATPKPRRQASRRTAAVIADFPDELMF